MSKDKKPEDKDLEVEQKFKVTREMKERRDDTKAKPAKKPKRSYRNAMDKLKGKTTVKKGRTDTKNSKDRPSPKKTPLHTNMSPRESNVDLKEQALELHHEIADIKKRNFKLAEKTLTYYLVMKSLNVSNMQDLDKMQLDKEMQNDASRTRLKNRLVKDSKNILAEQSVLKNQIRNVREKIIEHDRLVHRFAANETAINVLGPGFMRSRQNGEPVIEQAEVAILSKLDFFGMHVQGTQITGTPFNNPLGYVKMVVNYFGMERSEAAAPLNKKNLEKSKLRSELGIQRDMRLLKTSNKEEQKETRQEIRNYFKELKLEKKAIFAELFFDQIQEDLEEENERENKKTLPSRLTPFNMKLKPSNLL